VNQQACYKRSMKDKIIARTQSAQHPQMDPQLLTRPVLYVVSTPIGNLGDMTPRAVEILRAVDLVLAEDTRSFGKLAKRFAISTPSQSFFEHNERMRLDSALERLKHGAALALVSEAGTPTINDPGFRLVKACRAVGIPVSPVPGACAAIAALSVSGFETDSFYFGGFLPTKDGKRRSVLESALAMGVTVIFYESPFRILKTLHALIEIGFRREVFIAREMTKIHEEFLTGTCAEITEILGCRQSIKGEIVLVLRAKGV
jgi:16S rRNA (cytidine1402-2'-O)-methyltransferase